MIFEKITLMLLTAARLFGERVYSFRGLSAYKAKFRAPRRSVYLASSSTLPSNDAFLLLLAARISNGCFETLGKFLLGALAAAGRAFIDTFPDPHSLNPLRRTP